MEIRGTVGRILDNKISGWVYNKTQPNKNITLVVTINNLYSFETIANSPRPSLNQSNLKKTKHYGFNFSIPEDSLKKGNLNHIAIKEKKSNIELYNSPCFIDLRPLNNRVLIVGLNKSGTSILSYRIAEGLKAKHVYFEPKSKKGLADIEQHIGFTSRDKVVTKCLYHPKYSKNINSISLLYDKKIWIVRDPRDVLISSFFYMWYSGHNKPKAKFDQAYSKVLRKEANPSSMSFSDMIKGTINIDKYLKDRIAPVVKRISNLNKNWYILKYESFIDNEVSDLNTYLGFNINTNSEVRSHVKRVSRSNTYDNWRKWFTNSDIQLLNEKFKPILVSMGYDENDWRLIPPQSLDPKIGSEYMHKLYHSR